MIKIASAPKVYNEEKTNHVGQISMMDNIAEAFSKIFCNG